MTPFEEQKQLLRDVTAEMRHRAEEGCTGTHDGTCCDPEMEIHPEDWCNRCLMGTVVDQLSAADTRAEGREPQGWRSSIGAEFDPEFHMACDHCQKPGHKDSDQWVMPVTNGPVFCSWECAYRARAEEPEPRQDAMSLLRRIVIAFDGGTYDEFAEAQTEARALVGLKLTDDLDAANQRWIEIEKNARAEEQEPK